MWLRPLLNVVWAVSQTAGGGKKSKHLLLAIAVDKENGRSISHHG